VEFGSDSAEDAAERADRLVGLIGRLPTADAPSLRRYTAAEASAVWKLREAGPRAAGAGPNMALRWEGWDDASVAPEKLGPYLRELRALLDEFGYEAAYYGHFGHGCIHMQISFDLESEPGVRKFGAFLDQAADLVVRYGGSLSGEHGDGQARAALLPKMFGPELVQAFAEFKAIWDPDNRMNPHKIVDPFLPTGNLRLGADYAPQQPQTHFQFPDDRGSFAKAALRCTGLGACRKHDEGTMCPSYRVTLDEVHSTRGRAHMLFEMLQGEVVERGWLNDDVKASLDLCLSCKACKAECPTNVDMATYRAEFLAHYYAGQRRPLAAYAFGFVDRWARMASFSPAVANAVTRAPGLRTVVRKTLGLAANGGLPSFAPQTLQAWARRQKATSQPSRTVILWPDTFTNHFNPEIGRAAYRVLRHAGFDVVIPQGHFCCGRPLYDFGFLTQARAYLGRILQSFAEAIDAGTPFVVLEPSCASVFRDELRNLFPGDPRADRLRAQTWLLSELLERNATGYVPPRLHRDVVLHGHCHHKAIMKMTDEVSLLRRMGAVVTAPDAGCCGMAGPFGLMDATAGVARAIGEVALLPAVRRASAETLVVSDGFSCREQIRQGTGRRVLHLAEVLDQAL
jgi:Fe-S oxidoreductase